VAVAVDVIFAAIVKTGAPSPATGTATATISASATIAVLFIEGSLEGGQNDSGISWTTLTLGGSTFTQLASAKTHSGGGTTGFVDIYYILNPPTGSQTVTVTETGGTGNSIDYIATCISYTGALQTGSELGTAQTTTGSFVSSQTISATLASGDLFVGCCCNGTAAPGVTTGTSDKATTGGTSTAAHNMTVAHNSGTGSVSLVFSTNSADSEAATGVNIVASTGGGTNLDVPLLQPPFQSNVWRM
jgi:hypothetical protein